MLIGRGEGGREEEEVAAAPLGGDEEAGVVERPFGGRLVFKLCSMLVSERRERWQGVLSAIGPLPRGHCPDTMATYLRGTLPR